MIAVVLPVTMAYVGLDEAQNLDDVGSYIEQRQQYNQEGEAGVDISQLPVPLQMATYIYRPLPHEAWSIFALLASIEVLFLIALTVLAIQNTLLGGHNRLAGRSMFLWLYLIGGTYTLATTTANLGIAVRQKWMLMPALLVLIFGAIGRTRTTRDSSPGSRGGAGANLDLNRLEPRSRISG